MMIDDAGLLVGNVDRAHRIDEVPVDQRLHQRHLVVCKRSKIKDQRPDYRLQQTSVHHRLALLVRNVPTRGRVDTVGYGSRITEVRLRQPGFSRPVVLRTSHTSSCPAPRGRTASQCSRPAPEVGMGLR